MPANPARLQDFVHYSKQYIRGDEKSEAQAFLDQMFRAFGYEGAKQAGAEFEYRIDKGSAKGHKGYADLVWKTRLLIEMKSRGTNLKDHYSQVERYWMRLTPKPKYSLLCNFDEFWIFDFHNQVDSPVDVIKLDELPQRAGAFRFMELADHPPIFRNNQVEITNKTARRMGDLYREIVKRGRRNNFRDFDEHQAQRFVLQCVLAMFSEDRGLLPQDLFISCVQDCIDRKGNTYDILGGLFNVMNQRGITPAGRYQGVDYFNGGLFASIHPIELTEIELQLLDVCARDNWKQVRPSIFGNIFESAIDTESRHAHGIHFTSETDIRQIVIPTVSEYWESLIESANTEKELNALHQHLQSYRVLDPACGSGNFLYIAYQELKRIEKALLTKLQSYQKTENTQLLMGLVTPNQFYGMDINNFAVELARVTMMISRKIAIDTLELSEPALPLDTLDKNIACKDALFNEWVKADAIIGNPPFLGGSRIRTKLGDEYAEKIFNKFSDVRAQVDFSSYWFRLAHDHIDQDGRVGLVATNSVSQGKSRSVSLDYIVKNGGYIHDAISTQPWSGEAKVHVSIINWSKQSPQVCRLDSKLVSQINSALRASADVTQAKRLIANCGKGFVGMQPNSKGFYISEEQARTWISANLTNQDVLKPSAGATDLTDSPNGKPNRWIIDFADMAIEEIDEYTQPFAYIKTHVKPERENNREAVLREKWWRFKRTNEALRTAISQLPLYLIVPRHSKWFIFLPVSSNCLPADSTTVIASDDFYVLGILTSSIHRQWVKAQASTLEDRIRYTHNTCFETFPFPQSISASLVTQIRTATEDLQNYRSKWMEKKQWGITRLYREWFNEPSSQLAKLHAKLDELVMKAYGFEESDDILEALLSLNLQLAEREKQGKPVVGAAAPAELIDRSA